MSCPTIPVNCAAVVVSNDMMTGLTFGAYCRPYIYCIKIYPKAIVRTPLINDHCRSITINADQNFGID